MLFGQRNQAEAELNAIAWLLREGRKPFQMPKVQPYGDLTELNTDGTILRTVGKDLLVNVAGDALHLIGTSGAVCERNGDYASCLVASDWCRFLDRTSRERCGTADNRAALANGGWHCRESGREASILAMETGKPVDMPCKGGINLYAAPIKVDGETVGSIAIGYGDPPKDHVRLTEVAERYGVQVEKLRELSANMPSRPQFIVAVAKARLRNEANLLGEIIKRKGAEEALADLTRILQSNRSASGWLWNCMITCNISWCWESSRLDRGSGMPRRFHF
jgi:ligand-binding sensor protein